MTVPFYQSILFLAFLFSSLTFFTSCGHKSAGDGVAFNAEKAASLEGKYPVEFVALNSPYSGNGLMNGELKLEGDVLSVMLRMMDGPVETQHSQSLYFKERCPDQREDLNQDGLIDSYEVYAFLGETLIPFDSALESQSAGLGTYPISDQGGNFLYRNQTSFSQMLADLYSVDHDSEDHMMKLTERDLFKFEGKVILIRGVAEDSYLPASIHSLPHESDRGSLPIACGKILARLDK